MVADFNTWDGGKQYHENNWYPGKTIGLDPAKEWRLKGAHADVNGAHGGALAMMVTWESREGETHMLVYRLSYQYGDAIPPIETPADIVRRQLPGRSWRQDWPQGEARLDYCWSGTFNRVLPDGAPQGYTVTTTFNPQWLETGGLRRLPAYCCYIEHGSGCNKPAGWKIVHGDGPDDYMLVCTAHVGYLLTDAPEHRVYPYEDEG